MSQSPAQEGSVHDITRTRSAPAVKQTERPHPLTPFVRGWIVFLAILFAVAREVVPDGNDQTGFSLSELSWVLPVAAFAVLFAGVAGFIGWYFTRFVIDEEELRVETGAIFKSSKKVPFERLQSVDIIQPLAARLFGLAELRLEAGAGDSAIKVRYLRRAKAAALREYLLTRAHGEKARVGDLGHLSASVLTDLTAADRPLVEVSPQRLIGSFLLSIEWFLSAGLGIMIVVVSSTFDMFALALPGLLPVVISTVSLISKRLVGMFNFTLSESPRGLRITRGLTNLTSQSVPIDRIQGVRSVSRCCGSRCTGIESMWTSSAMPTPTTRTTNPARPACCFRLPTSPRSSWRSVACCPASTWMESSCNECRREPVGSGGSTSGPFGTAGTIERSLPSRAGSAMNAISCRTPRRSPYGSPKARCNVRSSSPTYTSTRRKDLSMPSPSSSMPGSLASWH